ncbi:hypothetical protein [uncultured Clostridium sp.]|uniref:hypothetical protein n=1 Tax=uncultured Clostridium sp. TaxID=59620 RepID=UPI002624D4EC|nr:hypothetical protein [uncultured Clostridium sp.]
MGEIGLEINAEKRERDIEESMRSRWCESIKKITFGFLFVLVSFQFMGFEYVAPIIGGWLLYSGLRTLKDESSVFKRAWYYSIVNIFTILIDLIIIATPLNIYSQELTVNGVIFAIVRVGFIFEITKGVRKFLEEKKVPLEKDPILRLGLWNTLIILLALMNSEIVIVLLIPMFIYYFYILTRIYKLRYIFGRDYRYRVNEKRKRNIKELGVYTLINVIVVLSCCVFSNHIILESREVRANGSEEKRAELIKLGFPKEILEDIEDEDLEFIRNPTYIKSEYERLSFYDSPKDDLESNTIFIETKENDTYVVEHFNWKTPKAFWRDEIEISTTEGVSLVSGKLIYEEKEKSYVSDIPKFKLDSYQESIDDLIYVRQIERILADVNYPFESKNNRGYIIYGLNLREGTWNMGNLVNYTHYNNPIRLPFRETGAIKPMFNEKMQQHHTMYETKLGRERE